MAGRGSRLRPHTLTTPKPLIPIAGKPIVQRLVEDIVHICGDENVEEVAFVIGDFGKEVEDELVAVAERLGAKGTIYHQDQPLGTAHAILCAAPSMDGELVVAFADTLFRADFTLDDDADGVAAGSSVLQPPGSQRPHPETTAIQRHKHLWSNGWPTVKGLAHAVNHAAEHLRAHPNAGGVR